MSPFQKLTFIHKKNSVTDHNPDYRLPHSQLKIKDEEHEKLLEQDIIESLTSPYNSPLLLVQKRKNKGDQ